MDNYILVGEGKPDTDDIRTYNLTVKFEYL